MKEKTKLLILRQSIWQVIDMNDRLKLPINCYNKNIYDLKEIVDNVLKGYQKG